MAFLAEDIDWVAIETDEDNSVVVARLIGGFDGQLLAEPGYRIRVAFKEDFDRAYKEDAEGTVKKFKDRARVKRAMDLLDA